MALKLNFREITTEDTGILRMVAMRNAKAEDYLCCDVTNEGAYLKKSDREFVFILGDTVTLGWEQYAR